MRKSTRQSIVEFFRLQQPGRGLVIRLLLPLTLLGIGGAWWLGNDLVERELVRLKARESIHVGVVASEMGHYLARLAGDLRYLARSSSLQAALDHPGAANLQRLAGDFVSFSRAKTDYDHIRWLDETGMERVRVDFFSGDPRVVAADALQDKKLRYYFEDTMRLDPGQIYVSPLDLNIEQGEIQRPFKSMLRMGTPVVDGSGQRRGIVQVDVYGEKFLSHSNPDSLPDHLSIVNPDGDWLKAPDSRQTRGFMPGAPEASLALRQPVAWRAMQEHDQGTLADAGGVWIWNTVHPLQPEMISSTGAAKADMPSREHVGPDAYFWKVVAHLDADVIAEVKRSAWFHVMTGLALLLAFLVFMARRIERSESRVARMSAELAGKVQERTDELRGRVTELERVRGELQRNETQLRNVKRLAGLGHWRWDLRSGDLYWSEEIYGFFGRDPQLPPLDDAGVKAHFTPEAWETLSAKWDRAINEGVPYHVDAELVRPDGTHRWLSFYGEAVRDGSGEIAALQGAAQDITERKVMERALSASEERLRHLMETSYDWIWELDVQGCFVYASPGIHRLLGYRPEEVIGRSAFDLMSPREAERVASVFADIEARQSPFHGMVNVNRHRDGHEVMLETSGVPIFDQAGNLTGWRGNDRDITEQTRMTKELEAYRLHLEDLVEQRTSELKKARADAEAAAEAKSTFLANMSHEIRTPMNAIVGLTHLLRRDRVTPEQSQRLVKVEKSALHLLGIINDILDLSKIEAGRLQLDCRDFALADVLDYVHSLITPSARAKGLTVSSDPGDVPAWLRGDPTRLRQALLNFASNAVKFTERGGIQLRVRVKRTMGDDLLLGFEVQDSGIGIDPDRLPDMFQAFEQAEVSTTRVFGGTGLGLAITQGLAEMMGGEVGAESAPGKGSRFWFTARLARGEPIKRADTEAGLEAESELRRRHASARLLLVEDNPINQEVAVDLLQAAGLAVDCAANGRQALAMAKAGDYALILMDMQMPEMDGVSATRAIRKLPGWEDRPILAMTANAFEEDCQACLDAGMDDFVPKPVEPAVLYTTLLRWLGETDYVPSPEQLRSAAGALPNGDPLEAGTPAEGQGHESFDDRVDELFARLRVFPELDAERGVKVMGGRRDRYIVLLQRFVRDHASDGKVLGRHLKSGDVDEAARLAHTLKGTAATVGADVLADASRKLEKALREKVGIPESRRLIDEIERAMGSLALVLNES